MDDVLTNKLSWAVNDGWAAPFNLPYPLTDVNIKLEAHGRVPVCLSVCMLVAPMSFHLMLLSVRGVRVTGCYFLKEMKA